MTLQQYQWRQDSAIYQGCLGFSFVQVDQLVCLHSLLVEFYWHHAYHVWNTPTEAVVPCILTVPPKTREYYLLWLLCADYQRVSMMKEVTCAPCEIMCHALRTLCGVVIKLVYEAEDTLHNHKPDLEQHSRIPYIEYVASTRTSKRQPKIAI